MLILSLMSIQAMAQVSNLRRKKIPAKGTFTIDTLSIVPKTFNVHGIDTSFYTIDEPRALIHWKKQLVQDSVEIVYRVFPYFLFSSAQRYSFDSISNNFVAAPKTMQANYSISENSIIREALAGT